MVVIHKYIATPELFAQLVSSDDLAWLCGQQGQDLGRLRSQPQLNSRLAQLASVDIQLEWTKPESATRKRRGWHGLCLTVVRRIIARLQCSADTTIATGLSSAA